MSKTRKLPKELRSKDIIDFITREDNVESYIDYFKDAFVGADSFIVKTIPRFETELFVPNEKEHEVRPEGIVVKTGENLSQLLVGKKIHWDFERFPISMMSRIKVKELKAENVLGSDSFVLIHKNALTYIK